MISDNKNVDLNKALESLNGLSEDEKKLAINILKEYAADGSSKLLDTLKYSDFEEIPVSIDQFLHRQEYLGKGLYDQEGRFTLFPYWEEKLKDIFPDNLTTKYNTLILSGSIGIGKTMCAVLAILYMLYRLLCLKDPYLYYGMQPIDKLSIAFINITIKNAQGVALDKMNQLIMSSSWFLSHGTMGGETNLMYRPNKHIEFVLGSSNNQIIGRALFCLDSETIIKTETGDYKLVDLLNKQIKVYSIDTNWKEILSNNCYVKPTIKTNEEYQIELENGTIIKCTGNHRLLLKTGDYKEAKDLIIGDKLLTSVKNIIKIKSVKKVILDKEKQYYDVVEAFPHHNFLIKTNDSYIISHNCSFEDEVNFAIFNDPERQKEKMLKLITQIDARMRSRFLRGTYLPTLNIIASSADTSQSFLQAYIKQKRETESKTTMIVEEAQWIVDSRKDSPEKFPVCIGNRILPNEMLPYGTSEETIQKYKEKGYQIWMVPIGYLEVFQQNLDEAICSIIGISTDSTLKYISGARLSAIKTNTYQNPFIRDIIEVGDAQTDYLQYANFFDLNRVNKDDLSRPLFIHLDLSLSGDKTGIAGVWITGKKPSLIKPTNNKLLPTPTNMPEIIQNNISEDSSLDLQYKLAFSVSVKAPKGNRLSFKKTRNFIRWLREQGFSIRSVSMDTFQSAELAQDLAVDGFKTQIISVDRVDIKSKIQPQYAYFKSAIYDRRLTIYEKCDLLTEEILQLEKLGNGKVEHQDAGKHGSKDQCDALCASVWAASKFADEYSYDYGDNLTAALDTNIADDEVSKKKQMIADFEEELAKIYWENKKAQDTRTKKEKEEEQEILDCMDGIIVL